MFHAAIVWQNDYDGESDFHGLMLTTMGKERYPDNILMSEDHFNKSEKFTIKFDKSHFVNQLFNKLEEWKPFIKEGELTEEGKSFIYENLSNCSPMTYEVYIHNRE